MDRHSIAMDKLATYTGTNPRMCELDVKLCDGGHLTTQEVNEVITYFRWDNMSKGN